MIVLIIDLTKYYFLIEYQKMMIINDEIKTIKRK
jgi:hypothetical protein